MKKLFFLLLIIPAFCEAQYDSTKNLQTVLAFGNNVANIGVRSMLRIPPDTLKLAVKDSGSIAYKNGDVFRYNGYSWGKIGSVDNAFVSGTMINDSTLRLYTGGGDSSTFLIKGSGGGSDTTNLHGRGVAYAAGDSIVLQDSSKYRLGEGLGYIPLSGTEVGKPVTGDVEIDGDGIKIKFKDPLGAVPNTVEIYDDGGVGMLEAYNGTLKATMTGGAFESKDLSSGKYVTVLHDRVIGSEYFASKDPYTYAQMQDIADSMSLVRDSLAAIRADMGTGGSGGISELGTGYGLVNVNDSTYEVDTAAVATLSALSDTAAAIRADMATGAAGSISGLTAATSTNTINNGRLTQEWQWNTLDSLSGLKLSSTSTAAGGSLSPLTLNKQVLLDVDLSGTNAVATQITYASKFKNNHIGTGGVNYAVWAQATGNTNNIAGYFDGSLQTTGNFILQGDDVYAGFDGISNRIGFTKKVGSVGKWTFGNGNALAFAQSNTSNIAATNTFTDRMILNSNGTVGVLGTNTNIKTTANLNIAERNSISDADINFGLWNNGISNTRFTGTANLSRMGFIVNDGSASGSVRPLVLHGSNSVSIGSDTEASATSILSVTSTTKGVLLPRLTTAQINAIGSPATGLTVYNTTENTICFYNGTAWQKVTSTNL